MTCMPFVMNTVSMCQIHHLGIEKERENLQTAPKNTLKTTNQAYHIVT